MGRGTSLNTRAYASHANEFPTSGQTDVKKFLKSSCDIGLMYVIQTNDCKKLQSQEVEHPPCQTQKTIQHLTCRFSEV